MDTDDFITMLARGAQVQPRAHATPAWIPVSAAAALSALLMAVLFGVNANLMLLAATPLFWVKLAFVGALAATGWRMLAVASIPGARFGALPWLLVLSGAFIAAAAAITLSGVPEGARAAQVWGATWRTCPFIIALLSLPLFAAMLHTMRARAPTRLTLGGAIAGFTSGAVAATLYCLHCPEMAPGFVVVWYVLGMLIPTVAGALLGRFVLAW